MKKLIFVGLILIVLLPTAQAEKLVAAEAFYQTTVYAKTVTCSVSVKFAYLMKDKGGNHQNASAQQAINRDTSEAVLKAINRTVDLNNSCGEYVEGKIKTIVATAFSASKDVVRIEETDVQIKRL
ncbi:hypothetical protein [Beggiatoa leptomitoformis]|uniref:Uncharacterized protein n=1 Tax=Beggiatoa leptomitoformis TaxID=288004 RepID=A0A2N9YDR3_9GAMM|nr:hypothetical protein [Beggiatoa leptomitoformis]ALG68983.1 hypothetical protein AL038_16415 [Beggiatoa leptomitoformis]AUI68622.1 hypothetical protein BLE401_07830 [Beggiatoa leptomitoformis]